MRKKRQIRFTRWWLLLRPAETANPVYPHDPGVTRQLPVCLDEPVPDTCDERHRRGNVGQGLLTDHSADAVFNPPPGHQRAQITQGGDGEINGALRRLKTLGKITSELISIHGSGLPRRTSPAINPGRMIGRLKQAVAEQQEEDQDHQGSQNSEGPDDGRRVYSARRGRPVKARRVIRNDSGTDRIN
ncbi:hypothetical protein [uncultured Brevundimonas sp.]|uniref:hypothetical protein n=1 Tax=uncultured Brevundimonas sp. TaxID=213418 RepID=UPI0030EC8A08